MEPQTRPSKSLVAIIIIAIVVVALGAIWYSMRDTTSDDIQGATTGDPVDSRTPSGRSDNIIVYMPRVNERVGTPLIIEGEARVFENVVNFRLVDSTGKELAEGFATADAPDIGQFGAFRGELNYFSETDQQGKVEIFTYSAKDGSEIEKVTIPVTITKTPEFIKA